VRDREGAQGRSEALILHLPDRAREEIEDGVREADVREACGLLLGRRVGETLEIARAVHLENAAAPSEADRFCISPGEHARWDLWAKRAGMAVVGVWHSHPSGPGWPSRADRAGGVEGWSHLIAAPGEGSFLALRSWRMVGGEFLEELLLSR
jgi:proteasome lid subunit RPN8/RPN11